MADFLLDRFYAGVHAHIVAVSRQGPKTLMICTAPRWSAKTLRLEPSAFCTGAGRNAGVAVVISLG